MIPLFLIRQNEFSTRRGGNFEWGEASAKLFSPEPREQKEFLESSMARDGNVRRRGGK
jgi:hypothetical protein